MKMVNELLAYETPQVEVIEVEVEKGFAQSAEDLEQRDYNWDEL